MKIMSLKINLENVELDEKAKKASKVELILDIVVSMIRGYAFGERRNGLDFTEQRKYDKIDDKFLEANKNNSESIEFEDAEFDFLVNTMKNSKLLPSKLVNRVYDLIEEAEKGK